MRYREVERKLKNLGCYVVSSKTGGSHRKWINPDTNRGAAFPDWGSKDLQFYRAKSYEEIAAKIGEQESFERVSEKGEPYQIEFDFLYDGSEKKDIRVPGMVSYSLWTDFSPVSSDFIIAPDGTFVGE